MGLSSIAPARGGSHAVSPLFSRDVPYRFADNLRGPLWPLSASCAGHPDAGGARASRRGGRISGCIGIRRRIFVDRSRGAFGNKGGPLASCVGGKIQGKDSKDQGWYGCCLGRGLSLFFRGRK